MLTRKLIIPVAALAIAGGATTVLATQTASAHGWGDQSDTMIQVLAQKLGKSESEVKAAFDEVHSQRQAEMQANFEAKLDEAVAAGKLTAAQKQLIVAKHAEMQAQREAERTTFKSQTREQRQAAMQQHRAEMEAWAKANGIDISLFMPEPGQSQGRLGRAK